MKPEQPPASSGKKWRRFVVGIAPMQFSDPAALQYADVQVIFKRGYHAIVGTEAGAGSGKLLSYIVAAAKEHGYYLSKPGRYDTWVAVRKDQVKEGTWRAESVFALWRSSKTPGDHPGRWGDKGVVAGVFTHPLTGREMAIGSVHYLTNGGAGPKLKAETDVTYSEVVAKWAKKYPEADVLVGGDFNRNDKKYDVFRGKAPFVTAADELEKWQNTGHGPIDALARRKTDEKVRFVSWRVLDDSEVRLNTDHFLSKAVLKLAVTE